MAENPAYGTEKAIAFVQGILDKQRRSVTWETALGLAKLFGVSVFLGVGGWDEEGTWQGIYQGRIRTVEDAIERPEHGGGGLG